MENTHRPIIGREEWETVQKIMATRRRECSNGETQMFSGLVKCAGCGSALNVNYSKKKGKYTGFSCWVYKNYGKDRCSSHAIGWKTLNTLVLEDVRRNAQTAASETKEYIRMLTDARNTKRLQEAEKSRRTLKKAQKRIAELDRILQKLYEDSALEKIPEERAAVMMTAYEQEYQTLREQRDRLQDDLNRAEEVHGNIQTFVNVIRKYTDIHELTATVLHELIDKIVVHEKEKTPDGRVIQTVEVHYRFIGCVPARQLFEGIDRINGIPIDPLLREALREPRPAPPTAVTG